eukprot:3658174-Amphidinium_carterae.1
MHAVLRNKLFRSLIIPVVHAHVARMVISVHFCGLHGQACKPLKPSQRNVPKCSHKGFTDRCAADNVSDSLNQLILRLAIHSLLTLKPYLLCT